MAPTVGYAAVQIIPSARGFAGALAKEIGPAGGLAGNQFQKSFGSRVVGALKTVGKVAAVAVGAAAAVGFVRLGRAAKDAAIDLQNSRAALTGLYGDANIADDTLSRLRKTAKASPIEFVAFAKGAETLAYMGVQGKEVDAILGNVAKAIVTAGGTSEDMDRVTTAMLQMQNSGRVYTQQLNQISQAGVPIFSGLAAHFGTNIANVRQMVTEGKVSLEDVMAVMENASGDTFQAMLRASDETSKTFANQWARARDNIVVAFAEGIIPILDRLAPIIGRIADEAPAAIEKGIASITRWGERAAEFFSDVDRRARAFGRGILETSVSTDTLNRISQAGIPIWTGIADRVGTSVGRIRALSVEGETTLVGIANSFGHIRKAAKDAGVSVGDVARNLAPDAVKVAESIWASLRRTWDGAKEPLLLIARSALDLVGTFAKVTASMGISYWKLLMFMLDQVAKILSIVLPTVLRVVAGLLERVAGWVAKNEWAVKALVLAWTAFKVGSLLFALGGMAKALVTKTIATVAATKAAIAHRAGMIALGTIYLAQRAANLASAAALGIKTIAMKAATAATWLFNAALRANPIGIVITALMALGAGLVILYKKSETFRNIVDKAFSVVAAVGKWMWEKVLRPVFNAIGTAIGFVVKHWKFFAAGFLLILGPFGLVLAAVLLFRDKLVAAFTAVGRAAKWLWDKAIKPAFNFITTAAKVLFAIVATVVLVPIQLYFRALGAVAGWLWNKAIKPAFEGIGKAARWLLGVATKMFNAIWSAITDVIGGIVRWVRIRILYIQAYWALIWGQIRSRFENIWSAIRNFVTSVFNGIVRWVRIRVLYVQAYWALIWGQIRMRFERIWNAIRDFVTNVFNSISRWLRIRVLYVQAYWALIWGKISAKFSGIWNGIRDFVVGIFTRIRDFISRRLGDIRRTWGRIWEWVSDKIDKVWKGGIKPVFDKLRQGIGFVRQAFQRGVEFIQRAWNKVANTVRRPINWVIRNVINDGIVGTFNKIAEKVGLSVRLKRMGQIPEFGGGSSIGNLATRGGGDPRGLKHGGRVRGPGTPTSDSIDARLSVDEHVINARAARQNRELLDWINAGNNPAYHPTMAMHWMGFSKGGRVYPVGSHNRGRGSAAHGYPAVDYPRPGGYRVNAAQAGNVTATNRWWNSYGHHVRIGHGNGLSTLYAHLSQIAVRMGQAVKAGTRIGAVGTTGNSTGNHLHFEALRNGRRIDPMAFLAGSAQGDSGGGFFGFLKNAFKSFKTVAGWAKEKGQAAWDFIQNGAGVIRHFIGKKISGWLDGLPFGDSWFGRIAKRVPAFIAGKIADRATALGKTLDTPTFGNTSGGTPGAKAYAQSRLGSFGWGSGQWDALHKLWQRESNWNHRARNPSSGAYGIPQSLPASKMASAGSDWLTNYRTQINWGLPYIKGRYGTPGAAWAFWQRNNWYDDGNMWPANTFGFNGTGNKEAVLNPSQWRDIRRAVNPIFDTPTDEPRRRGINIEKLEVQAFSDHFRLRDLEQELAMHGVS